MSELYRVHHYDAGKFDFHIQISRLLSEPNLEQLDDLKIDLIQRHSDQSLIWHQHFYDRFEEIRPLYTKFILDVIANKVKEPFLYQYVPNIRIHLKNNVAVGEWHKDSDYNHPQGERNFWLPVTGINPTSGINFIMPDGRMILAPNMVPGMMLEFDAVNTTHGNIKNQTTQSRVSIDFRILPVRCYNPFNATTTINTKTRFIRGEYYADEEIKL